MSLPIHVTAYSGYKANERPRDFTVDEDFYEIATVLDQWYEPSATYFKVRTTEGKTYLLRYDEADDEWTLQSGFDDDELLARSSIELIAVDGDVIRRAEKEIESCKHCHPGDAQIPVDWIRETWRAAVAPSSLFSPTRHAARTARNRSRKRLWWTERMSRAAGHLPATALDWKIVPSARFSFSVVD